MAKITKAVPASDGKPASKSNKKGKDSSNKSPTKFVGTAKVAKAKNLGPAKINVKNVRNIEEITNVVKINGNVNKGSPKTDKQVRVKSSVKLRSNNSKDKEQNLVERQEVIVNNEVKNNVSIKERKEKNTNQSENKQNKLRKKKVRNEPAQNQVKSKQLGKTKPNEAVTENNLKSVEEEGSLLKHPFLQDSKIEQNQVEKAVKALFDLLSKTKGNKPELFDEEKPVFLQVTSIKVPRTPTRILRLSLQNTLYSGESEICLITSDIKYKKAKDHEGAIDFYENLLRQKDVTNVKTIMPFHQLRTEYNTFELKRRLVELHDVFLVEGKISGKVHKHLGKIFMNKRKVPTPVKLHVSNVRGQIDSALSKTSLFLHSKGDNYIAQIGTTKMDEERVAQNILSAVYDLSREYPGGWENIAGLYIKTPDSMSIPIYVTLKNKNAVPVPVIMPKRSKAFKAVTDELSTYKQAMVTVLPTGDVELQFPEEKPKNEKTRKSRSGTKISKTNKSEQKRVKKAGTSKASNNHVTESPNELQVNEELESDNELEKEEQSYLQHWQRNQEVADEQTESGTKPTKKKSGKARESKTNVKLTKAKTKQSGKQTKAKGQNVKAESDVIKAEEEQQQPEEQTRARNKRTKSENRQQGNETKSRNKQVKPEKKHTQDGKAETQAKSKKKQQQASNDGVSKQTVKRKSPDSSPKLNKRKKSNKNFIKVKLPGSKKQ